MLAVKSEFEDCGMCLDTLDEAVNSVRYIFSSLNAYKKKTQFMQMERHKNLKKSVIELFQNTLEDTNYINNINELFAKQRLLLDDINKKENNNINELYNSFFPNTNNDASSNEMDIIKPEEDPYSRNSNNSRPEMEIYININDHNNDMSDEETESEEGDINDTLRNKTMDIEASDDNDNTNNAVTERETSNEETDGSEAKDNDESNDRKCRRFGIYGCWICDYKSVWFNEYEIHMWTVHGQRKVFKCQYCNKQFENAYTLESHESSIHRNDGKFKCSYCDKTFIFKSFLGNHIRVHTNERPFKSYCYDRNVSLYTQISSKKGLVIKYSLMFYIYVLSLVK